jgi:hypothetical protein
MLPSRPLHREVLRGDSICRFTYPFSLLATRLFSSPLALRPIFLSHVLPAHPGNLLALSNRRRIHDLSEFILENLGSLPSQFLGLIAFLRSMIAPWHSARG